MLKQLMLRRKIKVLKESLTELNDGNNFDERSAQLEVAIEEARSDEEIKAVEEEIDTLTQEQAEYQDKVDTIQSEIDELEKESAELEGKEPKDEPKEEPAAEAENRNKQKGELATMTRNKYFGGLTRAAMTELVERSEVQSFLDNTRSLIQEKRAVNGSELTIPEVFLELLRNNMDQYSKLITKVWLKPVKGEARQNIAGTIPEGIWTEMIGKLNEVDFKFNQVEVDGYKVGGFTAVPNSILKDSDLNLANEILLGLAQAIGLALDKAILYGKGTKMPVGIVTRLAETQKPNYWGQNEPDWTDLHETHLSVVPANITDPIKYYQELATKLNVIDADYSDGNVFWAMSRKTHQALKIKLMSFNSAAAIASGLDNTLPVIGGDVEELNFIPDGHIIGGFGSLYILAEREGATMAQSEHAQFIEDNTVFKGIARYDGRPIFGEAFVAVNASGKDGAVAPKPTDVTFAADKANTPG